MITDNPTYHILKSAIDKDYIKLIMDNVEKHNIIEPHVFTHYEGILLDYKKIDPENKINTILEYAKKYFQENYSVPGRDIVLSRSYGTIMNVGAGLTPHLDKYNSGHTHDFSYGDALVCNIYLSEFEGGELIFPELNEEIKPEIGDVIMFPGFLLLHGVNTVSKGKRVNFINHFALLSEEDTKNGVLTINGN